MVSTAVDRYITPSNTEKKNIAMIFHYSLKVKTNIKTTLLCDFNHSYMKGLKEEYQSKLTLFIYFIEDIIHSSFQYTRSSDEM